MVLLQPVVQITAGPVLHVPAQLAADRTRVAVVSAVVTLLA